MIRHLQTIMLDDVWVEFHDIFDSDSSVSSTRSLYLRSCVKALFLWHQNLPSFVVRVPVLLSGIVGVPGKAVEDETVCDVDETPVAVDDRTKTSLTSQLQQNHILSTNWT